MKQLFESTGAWALENFQRFSTQLALVTKRAEKLPNGNSTIFPVFSVTMRLFSIHGHHHLGLLYYKQFLNFVRGDIKSTWSGNTKSIHKTIFIYGVFYFTVNNFSTSPMTCRTIPLLELDYSKRQTLFAQ